jgi:hypothetical protein
MNHPTTQLYDYGQLSAEARRHARHKHFRFLRACGWQRVSRNDVLAEVSGYLYFWDGTVLLSARRETVRKSVS